MNHSFRVSKMSFSESNLISFPSHRDIWNLSLSVPAVQPFRGTLKSFTWHLARFSSCHYLSFSSALFTLCSSFLSPSANLKTSGLMFKAKGLESFPPTTQTSPLQRKTWIGSRKLFAMDTNRRGVLPKDEPNLLLIIWSTWMCRESSY